MEKFAEILVPKNFIPPCFAHRAAVCTGKLRLQNKFICDAEGVTNFVSVPDFREQKLKNFAQQNIFKKML